jgi:predicted enzyme related to lactoylglutathione lyase
VSRSAPHARRQVESRAARPATPAVPSAIGLVTHHMDYTSQDLEAIKRFYTEALGFSEFVYDQGQSYLMVKTGGTSSLGFMPPMGGPPEEWRPPREPAIYLIVEDVDRAYRDLVAKNVTFDQPPRDMPWMHRVALLRDPEGRRVCLAQILEP